MRANPWLETIRAGGTAIGGWISNSSTINADIMATAGFDYVVIDTQQGAIDYSAMLPMLQVVAKVSRGIVQNVQQARDLECCRELNFKRVLRVCLGRGRCRRR